jgi:16S rRNA (cytidine1402-2'-O)-methyltransferase
VPGPSAFTAALAASGQPPLPATLVGFLPPRRGARRRRLAKIAEVPWTMVVFLSPHRLAKELVDLAEILGRGRPATLLAELSKVHERALSATLGELVGSTEAATPRGEYVIVVGPPQDVTGTQGPIDREAVKRAYEEALAIGDDRKQALKDAARSAGLSRREAYALLFGDAKE